jgi:hypothetical protein
MNQTNTVIQERELFILNHKGWLYGTLYDDFASADHLMYRFTMRNPKGIILGDLSKTDFFYNYQKDKFNYNSGFKIQSINNENLIARQEMLNYFKTDFAESLLFFKEPNDYICSMADFKNNSKIFDPSLTSSNYACYQDETKLFYGGNPKILVEEDLSINLDLIQLQKCYVKTIDHYKNSIKLNSFNPCLNLGDFNQHFKDIVQANFQELLFEKKCQYTASVFRRIHEIYNENILLTSNYLVDLTYSYA